MATPKCRRWERRKRRHKRKKKPKQELKEIRRVVSFLVTNGFSLYELRKLYIDELKTYNEETIYTLEQQGKIPEGAYNKAVNKKNESGNTELKDQLMKAIKQQQK